MKLKIKRDEAWAEVYSIIEDLKNMDWTVSVNRVEFLYLTNTLTEVLNQLEAEYE